MSSVVSPIFGKSGGAGSLFGGSPGGAVLGGITKIAVPLMSYFGNNKAANRATEQQTGGYKAAQNELSPYMDTGKQANTMLQNSLSSGALGGTFQPGDLTKDPGYQFRLQQGRQALDRKAAASGGYFSGQALKDAEQFGQGLADQTYNDAYSRWLEQQKNLYNILSGQQAQGLNAANTYGGYASNIGTTEAQNTLYKQNNKNQLTSSLAELLGG